MKLDGVVGGILNELYMMNMIYHIIALMTQICKIRGIVIGDSEQNEPAVITYTDIAFYLTMDA